MDKSRLLELMKKVVDDRDQMAFSDIFDFLAPKLKAYFIQNGLSHDNSEELTQEVMSTIWTKSHQYNAGKSAFTTWAYTIARNKKVDFFRKNKKIDFNQEDIKEFLYENNQIDRLSENEAKNQISIINRELDADQRNMIKMSFFENKSHKKIAEELEIPLGTVKSRIRHILIKMQRIL